MTRDGIINIRNVGLTMVNSQPNNEKEKKFEELFAKICDRYYSQVRWDYPTDEFLKKLKNAFLNRKIVEFFRQEKITMFISVEYSLIQLGQQENWEEFIDIFLRYVCGISDKEYPTMSEVL